MRSGFKCSTRNGVPSSSVQKRTFGAKSIKTAGKGHKKWFKWQWPCERHFLCSQVRDIPAGGVCTQEQLSRCMRIGDLTSSCIILCTGQLKWTSATLACNQLWHFFRKFFFLLELYFFQLTQPLPWSGQWKLNTWKGLNSVSDQLIQTRLGDL